MSETPDCITRTGVVQSIEDRKVVVKIARSGACSSCQAKGSCTSFDSGEMMIMVDRMDAGEVSPGQAVSVEMQSSAGNRAVFYGYILPCLLVVITLVLAVNFTSDGVAGLISLGILLPYYTALYLFRDKLGKKFRFTINQ